MRSAVMRAAAHTVCSAVDADPQTYTHQIQIVSGINDCTRWHALAYHAGRRALTAFIVQVPQIWDSYL